MRLATILAMLLLPTPLLAACNPAIPGGVPFNCTDSGVPNPGDLFLGGAKSGPNQGKTVVWTGQNMLLMDHSKSPVTATNGQAHSLADWMATVQALQAGGTTTSGGTGSGTVNPSFHNYITWYPVDGSTVSGLATLPNGMLVTDGSGVPSIATTLPSGLTIPSPNFTGTVTGLPTGGGGTGTGTIIGGSANDMPFYGAAGTTLTPVHANANSLLVFGSSGTPSSTASLPPALSIPQPSISGPATVGGTGSAALTNDGATLTIQLNNLATSAATIFANTIGCASSSCFNQDAVRGVVTATAGSTTTNLNAVAGYVLNQNVSGGTGQNSSTLFGVGISDVDNAQTWGVNTNLTDSHVQGQITTGVGRVLYNEYDFNVTSASTTIWGSVLQGASTAQPANANGYVVGPLAIQTNNGSIKWGNAFNSENGVASTALLVGTLDVPTTQNDSSQGISFITTDNQATPAQHITLFNAQVTNNTRFLRSSDNLSAPAIQATGGGPASSGVTCVAGTITVDNNYIYVCTGTSTWKRAALGSF